MSEMRERVARAIRELPCHSTAEEMAQAAIAAMREPTEAMVEIAEDTPVGHSWGPGGEYILGADALWQAMIDAALASEDVPA